MPRPARPAFSHERTETAWTAQPEELCHLPAQGLRLSPEPRATCSRYRLNKRPALPAALPGARPRGSTSCGAESRAAPGPQPRIPPPQPLWLTGPGAAPQSRRRGPACSVAPEPRATRRDPAAGSSPGSPRLLPPAPQRDRRPPASPRPLSPAAHLVESVDDAPAGGARQAPPLASAQGGRQQRQEGSAERHGQRRPARARRGAGPHGEGAGSPGETERGHPSRRTKPASATAAPAVRPAPARPP